MVNQVMGNREEFLVALIPTLLPKEKGFQTFPVPSPDGREQFLQAFQQSRTWHYYLSTISANEALLNLGMKKVLDA